jgi:hypothetical protein
VLPESCDLADDATARPARTPRSVARGLTASGGRHVRWSPSSAVSRGERRAGERHARMPSRPAQPRPSAMTHDCRARWHSPAAGRGVWTLAHDARALQWPRRRARRSGGVRPERAAFAEASDEPLRSARLARVAELVYAAGLSPAVRKDVWVRVPPRALEVRGPAGRLIGVATAPASVVAAPGEEPGRLTGGVGRRQLDAREVVLPGLHAQPDGGASAGPRDRRPAREETLLQPAARRGRSRSPTRAGCESRAPSRRSAGTNPGGLER